VGGIAVEGGSHVEIAKLLVFSGEASRVMEFIIVYKLYLRIKMKGATVEKQVQWVLLYVQGELADV